MRINPVLYYVPNLIGYTRVILTIAAFTMCWDAPVTTGILYALSQIMDALDGTAARYFKQESKFGAVLDMLTDRMSTGVLLIVLSHQYPLWWGMFASLLVLDMVSHWFQMYSKLVVGASTHKGSDNALLNFYYTAPYALLVHCVGNEGFFLSLYILAFPAAMFPVWLLSLTTVINYVFAPIAAVKQLMNVIQLWESISALAAIDLEQATKKSKATKKK